MSNLPPPQYLSYLASGLRGVSDVDAATGFFFFNTVKFVKLIGLLAGNMNDWGRISSHECAAIIVLSSRRRVF